MDWAALSEELRGICDAEGWTFHPPKTEAELAAFERERKLTVPEPYRRFVREVTSGIDTDCMQLVPFGQTQSFPYGKAFGDSVLAALAAGRKFSDLLGDPAFACQREGAPPHGCVVVGELDGVNSVLPVVGEERGLVWQLGDLDFPETRHRHAGDGDQRRLDFGRWFECWLLENGLKLKTPLDGWT